MTDSSSTDFGEAARQSTSLLITAERRCLLWLAARLPRSITSDHLTGLALAAMAGAGACYWAARLDRRWLAGVVVCLAANWFGDSLDGTVARVRQQQRPRYGFYVDHVVDSFGVLFIVAGLALSGFMSPLVALSLLVAYFMLAIDIYLAAYALRVFKLSFAGIGPTELRLLLAVGSLALMRDPHVEVLGDRFKLFDVGGVVAIIGLGVVLLVSVATNVRALYRAEPIPRQATRSAEAAAALESNANRTGRRWLIFGFVGAMGFALQLGLVWTLTSIAGIDYVAATVIAVEAAILHNFFWHSSWTWSDRSVPRRELVGRLLRFNLTTGAVSLAGNVAVTVALVHYVGMPYVAANVIAIAACVGANFLLNHRLVFVASDRGAAAEGEPDSAPRRTERPERGESRTSKSRRLRVSRLVKAGSPWLVCVLMALGVVPNARGADLSPAASAAFDREAGLVAARLDDEREGRTALLRVDRLPEAQQRDSFARLRRGDIVVEKLPTATQAASPAGALLHHWIATTLIAGVALDPVVRLMQGYHRYQEIYRPEVRRSRVLGQDGNTFIVALQLFARKVISVVLNTESSVTYLSIDASRMQVRSVSTRIAEVRDAGEAGEREAPIGHDSGFLWRFNNYCALEGRVEGTYVQCETLSLTRDIPFGVGWLIEPFVTSIPRESLERTLHAMRTSLQGGE